MCIGVLYHMVSGFLMVLETEYASAALFQNNDTYFIAGLEFGNTGFHVADFTLTYIFVK